MKKLLLIAIVDSVCIPDFDNDIVLWDSYETDSSIRSIPNILEECAVELRSEYLNWSSSLVIDKSTGDTSSLVSFLGTEILNGGSYWWQTLIADKSPYKSQSIYDVFKLRVLEKIYLEGKFESLIYKGNDKKIATILNLWLKKMGHPFSWEKSINKNYSNKFDFRSFYNRLPKLVQVCGFLIHYCTTKLLFSKGIKPINKALCTIVSYFPGIDLNKAKSGEFYSNYWGPLHDLLKAEKIAVNWIWLHSNLQQLTYRETVEFQTRLNHCDSDKNNRYLLAEDNINLKSFLRALREYYKLFFKSFFLNSIQQKFVFPDSNLNFFTILENDWWESFRGNTAIVNCLYASSFQELGKRLPSETNLVIYVWENQPWEQSLISLKHVLKNAKFVGALHTPACCAFFNLKGFPGNKKEFSLNNYSRPYPDIIAVPSENTRQAMVKGGWPEKILMNVEALRYINSLSSFSNGSLEIVPLNNRNLLVVTGSIFSETEFQLSLLIGADKIGGLIGYSKIIIKAHPSVPIKKILEDVKFSIPYEITECSLSELWKISDVVFTANSTSVSLEAYYIGLPLIITGASGNLNINSLFGLKNVRFVLNIRELCDSLKFPDEASDEKSDFFNLDPKLSAWTSIFRQQMYYVNDSSAS
jgi:surface carbohydrate biosynthesis protein (TIGR04326 family)